MAWLYLEYAVVLCQWIWAITYHADGECATPGVHLQ